MEANVAIGVYNWANASWRRKVSSTSFKACAYLLWRSAYHQRHFRYLHKYLYVSGPTHAMENNCSCSFYLSEPQLLNYFNVVYPQNDQWRMSHLWHEMKSALISSLQCKRQLLT